MPFITRGRKNSALAVGICSLYARVMMGNTPPLHPTPFNFKKSLSSCSKEGVEGKKSHFSFKFNFLRDNSVIGMK